MNVLLKGREVAFYLKDSGAKHVFAWHGFGEAATTGAEETGTEAILVKPGEFEQLVMSAPRAEEDVERSAGDTAVILYTSGTTGTPKGAELTHDNLRENCTTTARTLIGVTEEDVILGALPLFHSFGQTCGLNAAIAHGDLEPDVAHHRRHHRVAGQAAAILEVDRCHQHDGVAVDDPAGIVDE